MLLLFAWMLLLHFAWLPMDPAELWVGGDAGHHGEDEDEDSGKNWMHWQHSLKQAQMHLMYLFIYWCALGPADATINYRHTKFLTLRKTQLRVCVVS